MALKSPIFQGFSRIVGGVCECFILCAHGCRMGQSLCAVPAGKTLSQRRRCAAGQECCLRLVSESAGAGTRLCRIFRGPYRAAGAAERSALGNAAALPSGKDFSIQCACSTIWERFFNPMRLRRKAAVSRSTASASPSCAGCAWLPDTRRTITSRSRRTAPCRWAGSAVQNLCRHRQREHK